MIYCHNSRNPAQICAIIKKENMESITIKPVSIENWFECTQLSATQEQEKLFPAKVVYWLAESKFEKSFVPLSIYKGKTLIGFTTIGIDPDTGLLWILAFLVDQNFQAAGNGKKSLKSLIEYIKKTYQVTTITLGHHPENEVAEKLYASFGFIKIETTESEIIRRLTFT